MRCGAVVVGLVCAGLVASCTNGSEPPPEVAGLPAQRPNSVEEFERTAGSPPVWLGSELTVQSYEDGQGRLDGPFFAFGVEAFAVGKAIKGPVAASGIGERRAEPGQELVVVAADSRVRAGQWVPDEDDPKPKAELVVGGAPTALHRIPLTPPKSGVDVKLDSAVVVASVPAGAPVSIRVTDAGRTQTMDLRTGRRGPDAIAGYYRRNSAELTWTGHLSGGISTPLGGGRTPVEFAAGFKTMDPAHLTDKPTATLAPYTPRRGWAPPGGAWLVVPRPVVSRPFDPFSPLFDLALSDPAVFSLRLPDGTAIPAEPGSTTMSTEVLGPWPLKSGGLMTFAVPAEFQRGTVRASIGAAEVTATRLKKKAAGSWSPAPAPFDIPVDLG
ncbi:hypothetical protein [Amycolatopsis sp. CA-230715]|uniref:hypothetical protein n=1 Tax=Amycolatopsis sp. CA-230715 TaxID=2745196 RepID=UPI001C017C16|nr:hypothetical protein [Amycolatopsis sp. CA-230715]QWF82449.1 hypothetical protein HUW46_05886 [Amycolatopsis sp. CA-230715]